MDARLKHLLQGERVARFWDAMSRNYPLHLYSKPVKTAVEGKFPGDGKFFLVGENVDPATLAVIGAALEQLLGYEHEAADLTRELSLVYEEITLLYRLSTAFAGKLQIEQIQQSAVAEIADTLEVAKVSVLMLTEDGQGLVLSAGLGVENGRLGAVRFRRGKGLAWRVVDSGQSLIANDLAQYADFDQGRQPDRSLLLVPLATKTGLAGVLAVSNPRYGREFTSKDEKLLATIAQQMGSVWENASLYKEAREQFLHTVEALSAAIDAKDPYTHGHSRRVTDFSMAIAEEMALPPEDLELIRISSLLHDIGKLGVSENILRKPDRLTGEEFAEIKKHPVIGAEIMSHVKKLSRFVPGMIDHHERFGGGGYPDGRQGEQISLAGRIIAVADTFDAITSDRPYHPDRKGRPDEVALAEIQRCRGSHFDPVVVDAFQRAYDRGRIKQNPAIQAPA
ncbi:MAG: HD domain-containing protein [Candidatus Riflebacteria bacterium]|nr:HD domain-containing protein [Candidatus Riflebacteria bacterium]